MMWRSRRSACRWAAGQPTPRSTAPRLRCPRQRPRIPTRRPIFQGPSHARPPRTPSDHDPGADADPVYDEGAEAHDRQWAPALRRHARIPADRVPAGRSRTVVDVAAGAGTLTSALRRVAGPTGTVLAVDRSRGMFRRAPTDLPRVQADAHSTAARRGLRGRRGARYRDTVRGRAAERLAALPAALPGGPIRR